MTIEATWTTERVQQLQSCITAGLTCSQIAAEIGVTRNAVIGKIHRMGLSTLARKPAGIAKGLSSRMQRAREDMRREDLGATPLVRLLRATAAKMAAAEAGQTMPLVIESARRCSLLELAGSHCRWPLGDPANTGFAFCGNDAIAGISYCLGHARLAYRLPSGRRA
ncbi:MAG: GcrA family cell cycle regulator [Xanthobacteraceae bacterium]